MLKKCIMVLLLVALTGSSAWAEKTIVCATHAQWPPMEFVNDDGKLVGYTIDFMEAVAGVAGFTVVFKSVAWEDMLPGLNEGKYDAICSSASITEERKKEVDFSLPYYVLRQMFVIQADTRMAIIRGKTGLRVGAQKGTTGYALAQTLPQINLKPYDDIADAMEELYVNRLDGVMSDEPVAVYYARTKYQNMLKVTGYPPNSPKERYAVAVKKGNTEVLDLINQGISVVRARGIDRELRIKWVTP